MKSSKALIILLLIILVGFIIGKKLIQKRRAELLSYSPPKTYPLPVEYAVAKKGTLREEFRYLGKVYPYEYASVSTKVAGTVLKVYKKEGERFKKGELLAKIDSSQIRNAVLSLENQKRAKESLISGLRSKLQAAKIAERNAKKEYERELFLYKRGAVPKEAVEKYQNAYEKAKATVKTILSQINELKHAIRAIERQKKSVASQLKYTEVRAVSDGTVARVLLYPGDVAVPGRPIMRVFYDKSGFRVLVNVPPQDAKELEVGSKVKVNGKEIGKLVKIYPAANRENGLYVAEVKLNSLQGIKPGELVETVLYGKSYSGIVLPYESILHMKNGSSVLVLKEGTVVPVPVKVLKRVNDKVVVSGNLKEGERVVVGRESKLIEVLRTRKVVPAEAFNG